MQLIFSDSLYGFTFFCILAVVYMNGFTDAPNAIASTVGTNALSMCSACRLSCIMNFIGVLTTLIAKPAVAQTMQQLLYFSEDNNTAVCCICAGMLSVFLWSFAAWIFGIPTSESHSLLAGLTGSVIAAEKSFSVFNASEWLSVAFGLLFSLATGFLFSACLCHDLTKHQSRFSQLLLRRSQIIGSVLLALLHGAQDGQKFTGILLLFQSFININSQQNVKMIPIFVFMCAFVMGAGSLVGGKRIIRSIGFDMSPLTPLQGVASDLSACLSLALCTFIGMPVSTTHVKTMSIAGAGFATEKRSINNKLLGEILLTWIFTFPGCGLIGYLVTDVLLRFL